jgi:DNA-binding response OmpR family regulator
MPARILIAEDDPKQADVLRRFLERDGFSATVVPDGVTAVEVARRRGSICWCWILGCRASTG